MQKIYIENQENRLVVRSEIIAMSSDVEKVWGLPKSTTPRIPTGFITNYQLDTIRNKTYSAWNSVEQVTSEKIEGHDMQRCLLILRGEIEFESTSKSLLQQVLPEELQPILQQLMPQTHTEPHRIGVVA